MAVQIDPFTRLPITTLASGTSNSKGLIAQAEAVVVAQAAAPSDQCPLELFRLQSSVTSDTKAKPKVYKYKYKYPSKKQNLSGCDSDSHAGHTSHSSLTGHLSSHDSRLMTDISYSHDSDTESSCCDESIPESHISYGKHEQYQEGLKNQAKQLKILSNSMDKAFRHLRTIKSVAVEQIVEAKVVYDMRLSDMTEVLRKQSVIAQEEFEKAQKAGSQYNYSDAVFAVSGIDMTIEEKLVCIVTWFVNLHETMVPMPSTRTELEWLYEAWKLKGECPCQYHYDTTDAAAAGAAASDTTSTTQDTVCLASVHDTSSSESCTSGSVYSFMKSNSSDTSSDCGACG